MSLPKSLKIIKNGLENHLPFDDFEKPIFIISPPRSGSTFLFDCLVQFKELFHISYEADLIWWKHFPYSRLNLTSDYIDEDEASNHNIHALKRSLRARASLNMLKLNKRWSHIPCHLGLKPICFIDKTISNCFHLDFINKAFPDAQFIFLLRDPRAVISSMMEGWEHSFQKPQLTRELKKIENRSIENWSYPAAPNWQNIVTEPLATICAWSWKQHIEYPMKFFKKHDKNVTILRYEDLTTDTFKTLKQLSVTLGLTMTEAVEKYLDAPAISRTTVSAPQKDKWKVNNKAEIESIIPMISELASEIGYEI